MIGRREFITLVGGVAAAWPIAGRAQQPATIPKVGIIFPRPATAAADNIAALKNGLRDLGYIEGETFLTDWFFSEGNYEQIPAVVERMITGGADLLLVGGTTPAMIVRKSTTKPIVFVGVSDPVGAGLAESLARPGGNATGLATAHEEAYAQKSLELLKEIIPSARHVAVLYNPANPFNVTFLREVQRAANTLRVELNAFEARTPQELIGGLGKIGAKGANALIVATDPFLAARVQEIIAATNDQKLPAIFGFREYPRAGGLMSYGANLPDMYRRVAVHVARILKGAKPSELPVELPTKFELIINLKTAKSLGLTVPPTLLARADEVIE